MTDTKETFTCTVESASYHEADVRAWDCLAKYHGKGISRDSSQNWILSEINHGEHPEKPDTLVSSATFTRDGDASPKDRGGIAVEEPDSSDTSGD